MSLLNILSYFVIGIYTFLLIYICIHCLLQFQLLYYYRKSFGSIEPHSPLVSFPKVTIQLPVFNEMYVAERLIDSVCKLDYPKDKLQIQVLDDSTDETLTLTRAKVNEYRKLGFNIELVHREDRTGYKAGALQHALQYASGEFVAIFDADFLPKKDFLLKTLPYFENEKVGVVQTRWEHINQDYSLITQIQALQLNVHFTVEQKGRDNADFLLQFNGTAGLWRRITIDSAGGWHADTLTEDLDLSYRAQLKGWKIKFLEHLGAPAELPVEMNSFKSQQHRWMKGGAETAKKLLPVIWRSHLKISQKIHATVHLLGSTIFLFIFALGVLSVPALFALRHLMMTESIWSVFIITTLVLLTVYYIANVQNPFVQFGRGKLRSLLKFIVLFPLFISLSMGLSLHNSIAVIQGYLGKKSAFVRTPKFNIQALGDQFNSKTNYLKFQWDWRVLLEGFMALYFLIGMYESIKHNQFSMIFFHFLLFIGYSSIFYFSIRDMKFK